ncbi:hypothetical protein GQ53DRAFT_860771 [Thozetella sp. PMI_491]|nr:hypothetical protein GQ53DRAFT_860771 [Thozetella sp. PMI_491]
MVAPARPPANGFVRVARLVYNPIGFSKGYNFVFFFICIGALMGFTLSRLMYLNFYGVYCSGEYSINHAGPGECFYYLKELSAKTGIIMHLAAVLPAAFLACFQFVPAIRHKVILFHRVNGYVILLLGVVSVVGVFLVARHAMGGTMATQYAVGGMSIMFLGSMLLAYINIKRLQIEQHRAWMIRAWAYASSIITLRIIMSISAMVISNIGDYYMAKHCDEIDSILGGQNATLAKYPSCEDFYSGANPNALAAVKATFPGKGDEVAAALGLNFGAAAWLALTIHAVLAELYLNLTPAETERLRKVSYQRQLEAGMKNPGSAGLTTDRLGDAPRWTPKEMDMEMMCHAIPRHM